MVSRLWVPAVEEASGAVLGAGDPGDQHAIPDQRRSGHRITIAEIDRLLPPQFLTRCGVERDHIGVKSAAEDLTVVERDTAIVDAATDDARGFQRIIDLRLPDLLSSL